MTGPLLETKLHVPRRRRGLVARARLGEQLSRAAESALTLVSAPAGFGKTTLIADWLDSVPADERSVAWLSLDKRDNDPTLFWTYLVTALQNAEPRVGAGALSLLQSPPQPIESVLGSVLNDLAAVPNEVVLVLDDYHLIEAREVQDGMAFLLEHLPAQAHLVIVGRADPTLPLARLRGRGELVEIRSADLRFTVEEATAYLNEAMGLALTTRDVASLEGRTEGWIAALQLAALSLQGRDDVAGFIDGFAGDDRYIVDYLVEEVLQRQPEHVHRFLLQTSILDRLCGPLCDAVTGQDGSQAKLAALERGNLFLAPLDDRRRWYRYHQLFADVLHARLLDEQPDDVPDLHRRASVWYGQNGEQAEAIRHALAGRDFERAADLVELAIPAMRMGRQEAALQGWLTLLPDEVVRVRPVLLVGFAGALLANGQLDGLEARLKDAERWLTAGAPPSEMVVVDEGEFPRLPAAIALYRAAMALARGDALETRRHARRALELAPDEDHLVRASASGLLGLVLWTAGDLDEAHSSWAQCIAGLRRAAHLADTFGCAIALADIRIVQGRLGDAMRTYQQALQLAPARNGSVLRGTADMYVGISELYRERNDLPAATAQLVQSQELGEHVGLPQNRYRWRVAMARIREAEGDVNGALELLDEAESAYAGDFFPNVRPVAAVRARVWITQGRLVDAFGWARELGLSADDDLSYVREFEHVTLARAVLAGDPGTDDAATRFLERLLRAAEAAGRAGSVIEILVLQALAHHTQGDLPAALASLQRALTLAEPEGYVRIFVDEGPPMTALLRSAAGKGIASSAVGRLLAVIDQSGVTSAGVPASQGFIEPQSLNQPQPLIQPQSLIQPQPLIQPQSLNQPQSLIQRLSERELEVLRLLATDLDGPGIARRLVVSLHTVRTHTRHIYEKLGVNNRRAAVRRAAEIDLLSRTQDS